MCSGIAFSGNRNFGTVIAHIVPHDIKAHICKGSHLNPAVTVGIGDSFEDSPFFDPSDHSRLTVGFDAQVHISESHIAVEVDGRSIDRGDIRSGDLKPGAVALEDLHFFAPVEFHSGRRSQFGKHTGIKS